MLQENPKIFQTFKYFIYCALLVTTTYFFFDDLKSSSVVYTDGIKAKDIIVAFSAFIDTAAWLVLLLILELETYIIPDEKLKGVLKWTLTFISIVCGIVIVYAFYGYLQALSVPNGFSALTNDIVPVFCDLVKDGSYSFAQTLDEYVPLDMKNCAGLGEDAFYNNELKLYATPQSYKMMNTLAWTDIINSATWILIVIVLELEVILKSSKLVGTKIYSIYKRSKLVLYAVLFICMIIWAVYGDLWSAWDALLWLLAFFFIEMNVVSWQEEVAEKREGQSLGTS